MKHVWQKTGNPFIQMCSKCESTRITLLSEDPEFFTIKYRTTYYVNGKKHFKSPACIPKQQLNRQQAIEALKQGKRLIHPLMLKDYWVKYDLSLSCIIDSDGWRTDFNNFWRYKQGEEWNKDWKII